LFAGVGMDLALTGRNWPVNGSSFFCIMVIIATKRPKLSIQDENEWLDHDPAARFINNLTFHKRNKPVFQSRCCGKNSQKCRDNRSSTTNYKVASGYQKKVATVGQGAT